MGTSATAVSRALTAAGETRSVLTMSGMVKGYGTTSRGFRAENVVTVESRQEYRRLHRGKGAPWGTVTVPYRKPTGEVTVEYVPGSWGKDDDAVRDEHLVRYATTLVAKGFSVKTVTDEHNGRVRLHVTKP